MHGLGNGERAVQPNRPALRAGASGLSAAQERLTIESSGLSFPSLKQRNLVEVCIPGQQNGTVLESRCGYPDIVGGDTCPLPPEERNQVAVTPRNSVFDANGSYTSLTQEESELVLVFRSSSTGGKSGV